MTPSGIEPATFRFVAQQLNHFIPSACCFYPVLTKIGFVFPQYEISRKYVRLEPNYSMRMDKRTDTTKLVVSFRNFVNAPQISTFSARYVRVSYDSKSVDCFHHQYISVGHNVRTSWTKMYGKVQLSYAIGQLA